MKTLDGCPAGEQAFPTFEAYAATLDDALRSYSMADIRAVADAALDGMPARVLRNTVSAHIRRDTGTFFSGGALAARLVEPYADLIRRGAVVVDAACGAGDLLLAAASHLSHRGQFNKSADEWNRQLRGFDVDPAFVRVARARLLLLLQRRRPNVWTSFISSNSCFQNIQSRNSLDGTLDLGETSLLLLNPPFGKMPSPEDCPWGSGMVARAAVFTEIVVKAMPVGSHIALILPDVLRSGARYEKWRAMIASLMITDAVEVVGRFDRWADVDVFIMRGVRAAFDVAVKRPRTRARAVTTISDLFTVTVGAVVPQRDPKTGPTRAFLHAKGLPRFSTVNRIVDRRQYQGTVVTPPFVVIRRTSRPGDGEARAIGTLIDVSEPVAVENHLIVARPHDGSVETCQRLLRLLKSAQTTKTLNRQTRCRHLSIRYIKALRWREVDPV